MTRFSLCPVVLPTEGDAMLVHGEDTAVRDCPAVGIAREVSQHFRGTRKRALGITHPLVLAERREPASEVVGIGERQVLAEELQAPAAMESVKLLEETTPK